MYPPARGDLDQVDYCAADNCCAEKVRIIPASLLASNDPIRRTVEEQVWLSLALCGWCRRHEALVCR